MQNINNEIMIQKLNDVNFCVAVLASKNLTIGSIDIDVNKPVITIQTNEKEPAGLKGGFLKRTKKNGQPWQGYATVIENCQVQWMVAP